MTIETILSRLRRAIRESPTPAAKAEVRHQVRLKVTTLRDDLEARLQQAKRAFVEATGEETPQASPAEARTARTYRISAWCGVVLEIFLTMLIFRSWLVPKWVAIPTILLITLFSKSLVHALLVHGRAPEEAARIVKWWLVIPGTALFFLALSLWLILRWAPTALPVEVAQVMLPIATVGIVLGATGLLLVADILNTKPKLEKQYLHLEADIRACNAFLEETDDGRGARTASAVIHLPRGAAVLFFFICASTSFAADAKPTCDIVVDVSGSLENTIAPAWERFSKEELPAIAEGCARVIVSSFSRDGWVWTRLAGVVLPEASAAPSAGLPMAELAILPNVQEVLRQRGAEQQRAREEAVRQAIRQALGPISALKIPADRDARATDVVGCLLRVAEMKGAGRVVILTDLADTTYAEEWPSITAPANDLRLLVLFVPAANDRRPGAVQYMARQSVLKKSAPWVRIAPAFAYDLVSYLR